MSKEEEKLKHVRSVMITALCCSQVLGETLDELKDTDFYRQSLKKAVKDLEKELIRTCGQHIEVIFAMDETLVQDIMEGMMGITKEVATMQPERIAALGQLFKTNSIGFKD